MGAGQTAEFLQTDEVSVRTIVQRHNLVCGELLATLERDMRISAECQESLERELLARRKAVETLTAKTKRMSDTIRKQGERIKELEAVKPCKCKQPTTQPDAYSLRHTIHGSARQPRRYGS